MRLLLRPARTADARVAAAMIALLRRAAGGSTAAAAAARWPLGLVGSEHRGAAGAQQQTVEAQAWEKVRHGPCREVQREEAMTMTGRSVIDWLAARGLSGCSGPALPQARVQPGARS